MMGRARRAVAKGSGVVSRSGLKTNLSPSKTTELKKKNWPTSKPHKRKDPTEFQSKVYTLISTIPKGKVSSYGEVARKLNSAPRAVGNALRNNPFAPKVPCHRVVAASRLLGGFGGQKGHESPNVIAKKRMLQEEGVGFDSEDEFKVAVESMYRFP